jgi:hypothetical protein
MTYQPRHDVTHAPLLKPFIDYHVYRTPPPAQAPTERDLQTVFIENGSCYQKCPRCEHIHPATISPEIASVPCHHAPQLQSQEALIATLRHDLALLNSEVQRLRADLDAARFRPDTTSSESMTDPQPTTTSLTKWFSSTGTEDYEPEASSEDELTPSSQLILANPPTFRTQPIPPSTTPSEYSFDASPSPSPPLSTVSHTSSNDTIRLPSAPYPLTSSALSAHTERHTALLPTSRSNATIDPQSSTTKTRQKKRSRYYPRSTQPHNPVTRHVNPTTSHWPHSSYSAGPSRITNLTFQPLLTSRPSLTRESRQQSKLPDLINRPSLTTVIESRTVNPETLSTSMKQGRLISDQSVTTAIEERTVNPETILASIIDDDSINETPAHTNAISTVTHDPLNDESDLKSYSDTLRRQFPKSDKLRQVDFAIAHNIEMTSYDPEDLIIAPGSPLHYCWFDPDSPYEPFPECQARRTKSRDTYQCVHHLIFTDRDTLFFLTQK